MMLMFKISCNLHEQNNDKNNEKEYRSNRSLVVFNFL